MTGTSGDCQLGLAPASSSTQGSSQKARGGHSQCPVLPRDLLPSSGAPGIPGCARQGPDPGLRDPRSTPGACHLQPPTVQTPLHRARGHGSRGLKSPEVPRKRPSRTTSAWPCAWARVCAGLTPPLLPPSSHLRHKITVGRTTPNATQLQLPGVARLLCAGRRAQRTAALAPLPTAPSFMLRALRPGPGKGPGASQGFLWWV